jgi:hypothetical protein
VVGKGKGPKPLPVANFVHLKGISRQGKRYELAGIGCGKSEEPFYRHNAFLHGEERDALVERVIHTELSPCVFDGLCALADLPPA